jgi:hypothetical protein
MLVAQEEMIKMVISIEKLTKKEPDVMLPDKFKITTKWIVFSEAILTYLGRLKGTASKIPLNYVLHDNEVPDPNAIYETEQEQFIQNAALHGAPYMRDNERVYSVIKQHIVEGPAWSSITPEIDRANDGRAWLALHAHYEGASFTSKHK